MAIFETGGYRVKKSGIPRVKKAIKAFVRWIKANEPGTLLYMAWQEKGDPTKFLHLFIFKDAAANRRHGQSDAVKRFEAAYRPVMVSRDVTFTEYRAISNKIRVRF